ncbi:MAG: hypothetical protein V3U49_08395 [Nitrososphaerales archaeon]
MTLRKRVGITHLGIGLLGVLILMISAVSVPAVLGQLPSPAKEGIIHVEGSNTWIVGNYGHNFVYDGTGYRPTTGFITIDVDDVDNSGIVVATWDATDYYGMSGTFTAIWTDFFGDADFMNGGIATGGTLHGASGHEAPVLPEVRSYVSGWGSADVYLDGEMIYDDIVAHFMVTDETRDPITHAVYNADRSGFFSPMNPGDGSTFKDRILTHLVLHTDVQDVENFPPFTVFMHINFENTGTSTPSLLGLDEQAPQSEVPGIELQTRTLEQEINAVEQQINTVSTIGYTGIGVGVVGVLVGLGAVVVARRRI